MSNYLYGSVCRISDLPENRFDVEPIDKSEWDTGDYVVGTISKRPSHEARIEAPTGRTIEPLEGEPVVGAFGTRHATRGIVGDWRDINADDGSMHIIGGGGIIGQISSISPFLYSPIELNYDGHVCRDGEPLAMSDFVEPVEPHPLNAPVILILGTSMSSGKTMSARVITRTLSELGLDPVACKLSGSGRYHDVLTMKDAGAVEVFDFMDVGLPTTVVPTEQYRENIHDLLHRIGQRNPDVLVAEIGASPLEPYNGDCAIAELQSRVAFTVLTASDPYAVVGLQDTIDIGIDLVTGITTNTDAGIDLIDNLTRITLNQCQAVIN